MNTAGTLQRGLTTASDFNEEIPRHPFRGDSHSIQSYKDSSGSDPLKPSKLSSHSLAYSNLREGVKETLLQRFRGVVTKLDAEQGEFEARLTDWLDEDEEEFATFYIEEIPTEDAPLITEGAEFFWYIGYEEKRSLSRVNFSKIRFRRLLNWSASELERIKNSTTSILSGIPDGETFGPTNPS